jgi:hypothetical protein
MKRHRIIVVTLSLLASTLLLAPSAASARGPLLSGYGPPGAGAQTILGAALVNGSGGGAGGGSTGSGSSAAAASASGLASGASAAGVEGNSATTQRSATGKPEHARDTSTGRHSTTAPTGATSANPRAAGANPNPSHLGSVSAVGVNESSTSWFSGSDLLALLLASGAVALVALTTIRLTRTEHD